jgi:hypothetical protein
MAYTVDDSFSQNTINSFQWQFYGMGYNSYTTHMLKNRLENGDIVDYGNDLITQFRKYENECVNYVKSLPTLFEYLEKNIY